MEHIRDINKSKKHHQQNPNQHYRNKKEEEPETFKDFFKYSHNQTKPKPMIDRYIMLKLNNKRNSKRYSRFMTQR